MNPQQITLVPTKDSSDTHTYTAVFVVPAPVLDDSGITHLVEHLVFRSSRRFPHAWNLSNLLHLTPYTINASVTQGLAYFHLSATNKDDFYLLLSFLWAGLMERDYSATEVENECRVIARELQMHNRNARYRRQSDLWLSDTSAQRYRNYGGYCHSICQLTPEDVRTYKASYYRADSIRLFVQGLTATDRDEWLAMQPLAEHHIDQSDRHLTQRYQPKQQAEPDAKIDQSTGQLIATWWLPKTLADVLLSEVGQQQVAKLTSQHPALWLDIEPNAYGDLALRLIANDWQVTWQDLMADLTVQQEQACDRPLPSLTNAALNALPPDVEQLVSQCCELRELLQPTSTDTPADTTAIHSLRDCYSLLVDVLNTTPQVSPLTTFDVEKCNPSRSISAGTRENCLHERSLSKDSPDPTALQHHGLMAELRCGSSLRQGRYLPRSVATDITQLLADNTSELAPWIDNQRWLYPLHFDQEPLLHALAISGQLWRPRTDGWLYAMGVSQWATDDRSLWVVWGVADDAPRQTVKWLERLLDLNRGATDANHQH